MIKTIYQYLDTINIWQQFNSSDLFCNFLLGDRLFRHIRNDNIEVLFTALKILMDGITALSMEAYKHAIDILCNGQSLLNYPPLVTIGEACKVEFSTPLLNLKTSSYIDMLVFLNHITV